jgi:hypothetical protein
MANPELKGPFTISIPSETGTSWNDGQVLLAHELDANGSGLIEMKPWAKVFFIVNIEPAKLEPGYNVVFSNQNCPAEITRALDYQPEYLIPG